MGKLLDHYCRLLNLFMAVALVLMTSMVFGNVILRYLFNSGITLSEEFSRWLLVWVTFVGAVVALRKGGHLGTDVLLAHLPAWGKRLCLVIAQLMMLYATWLLFSGSLQQAIINSTVMAPASELPMAIVYAAGVFFSVSAFVILLYGLWCTVVGKPATAETTDQGSSGEVS